MFRVTIEQIDESGRIVASSMRMGGDGGFGLGSVVGLAMASLAPARPDLDAAQVIEQLEMDYDSHDFFDQHSAEVSAMIDSAGKIISGWTSHDKKPDKKTR